jgi:Family of unknown function (DUF5946)
MLGVMGLSPCPGCGLLLPGPSSPDDPRRNASPACQAIYGQVLAFGQQHLAELGRWHQLLVDTYGAQHAGGAASRIGVAFSLIGLELALERGWDGLAVRDAHQSLAARYREWPPVAAPAGPWPVTVADLAAAAEPDGWPGELQRWSRSVWDAWRPAHPVVRALIADRLGRNA